MSVRVRGWGCGSLTVTSHGNRTSLAITMSTVMSASTAGITISSTNEMVVTIATTSNKGGWPKGSMSSTMKARHILVVDVTGECAIDIAYIKASSLEKSQKEGKTRRVPRGAFKKSISKVCEKYNLERSEIRLDTVLSRNKKAIN
jgi:hypothetical protein